MHGMDKIFDICNSIKESRMNELNDETIRQLEEEQETQRKKDNYKFLNIPLRYWSETLDTYKPNNESQTKALNECKSFIQCVKFKLFKTLVLLGTPGTGKTHLACSIVKQVGGKYKNASELVEELRCAKSFSAERTESQILEKYANYSLLVIDEIGRSINATDEKYMLYQILNARYNTQKATVLISNHSKKEFLQYIGFASADRLVESADIVEMNGESYRLTKRVINDTKPIIG